METKIIEQILSNKSFIEYLKSMRKTIGSSLILILTILIVSNLLYQEANAKVAPQEIDIEELIKTADIDKGQKIFKKCASCHSIEKGGRNKVGPNLHGIVGKKIASVAEFSYSNSMKDKNENWDNKNLNQFIRKPKDFVPGTKMFFSGLPNDQDRANVIAYLISEGNK